jgi:hypothetical protein
LTSPLSREPAGIIRLSHHVKPITSSPFNQLRQRRIVNWLGNPISPRSFGEDLAAGAE